MAVKVYEGGIASFNGPILYPTPETQGPMFTPDPTKGEVGTTAGSPAPSSGSSDGGFVMDDKNGYGGPADMEPGAMKVVDLDDIKGTEIVNIGNINSQTDGY